MQNETLANAIEKMPKVELHVHLKGATRPETILKLAQKNSIDLPAKTLDEMIEWFKFKSFHHFLDVYRQTATCFAEPEDVEFAAREFLVEQARQNIIYTELTYTVNRTTMRSSDCLAIPTATVMSIKKMSACLAKHSCGRSAMQNSTKI